MRRRKVKGADEKLLSYKDYVVRDNIESLKDCLIRANIFLEKLKENYNDKTILIVSHGAFIKCLHFAINGYDKNTDFLSFNPKNTTIYEYVIE